MGGFTYPALAWGFLIVGLPLLIHLINVLRLRRVQWAAMDFLMKSYKKHRRWVWLKQLLLLLLRMAAFAALVLMLAQWDPSQQWLARLQQKTTHHIVLLDDSYSMSEQVGGGTAFDAAMKAIEGLASDAGQRTSPQRFTLLRLSRATDGDESAAGALCDINGEMVDQQFDVLLEEKRRGFNVTQLTLDMVPALKLAQQLMDNGLEEDQRVYLISDFRERDWEQPAEVREALDAITTAGAELHFVRCVRETQGNLAITEMQPASDTRAAGVPLFVNVTIRNHGQTDATKVQLRIQTAFYSPQRDRQSPEEAKPDVEDAPVELIDSIPAGEEIVRRIQVYFPQAGKHVVQASLPDDAVNADNQRWIVVEFPEFEPTLIVDGDVNRRNGYYLQSIFQPGQRVKTGVGAEVQSPDYLRDASEEELQRFTSIHLCDVERLDDGAIKNLERFVSEGGGLAIFSGPQLNFRHYNTKLYRDGEGVLPTPIGRDVAVRPPENLETPYVTIENPLHPIFQELFSGNNPLIGLLRVDRSLAPPSEWRNEGDDQVAVLATLHSGEPLVVEKSFGRGRVVMFLTTLAPTWNDMALGPNVLITLKLQAYLAAQARSARLGDSSLEVGQPLTVRAPLNQYRRDWKFSAPSASGEDRILVSAVADKNETDNVWVAEFGGQDPALGRGVTDIAGVYEAWLATNEGSQDVRRFAMNVAPEEGELTIAATQTMLSDLEPIKLRVHDVDEGQLGGPGGGDSRFDWLFAIVVGVLLLVEQALAFSASYHPPGAARR